MKNLAMSFIQLGDNKLPYGLYIKNPWPRSKAELWSGVQNILLTNRGMATDRGHFQAGSFLKVLLGDISNSLFKTQEQITLASSNIIPVSMQAIKSDFRLNTTIMSRYGKCLHYIDNAELSEFLMAHCMTIAYMRAGVTKKDLGEMNAMQTLITTIYVFQGVETWAKEHFRCGLLCFGEEPSTEGDHDTIMLDLIQFHLEQATKYDFHVQHCPFGVPEAFCFDGITSMECLFTSNDWFNQPIGAW